MPESSTHTSPPPRRPRFRKSATISLATLVLVAVVWIALRHRAADRIAGIYMADGGQSIIRIEKTLLGGLVWAEGQLHAAGRPADVRKHEQVAEVALSGHLLLSEMNLCTSALGSLMPFGDTKTLLLEMTGNASHPADMDLVAGSYVDSLCPRPPFFSSLKDAIVRVGRGDFGAMWEWVKDISGYTGHDALASLPAGYPYEFRADLSSSDPPFRRFLHRIDDKRLLEYARLRREGAPPGEALAELEPIADDHPDDPWIALHIIELEAESGNLEQAKAKMGQWIAAHASAAPSRLLTTAEKARRAIERLRLRDTYPGMLFSHDLFRSIGGVGGIIVGSRPFPPGWDLADMADWLVRRAGIAHIAYPPAPLIVATENGTPMEWPDFLAFQYMNRISGILSNFALMEGNPRRALDLLIGTWMMDLDQATADGAFARMLGHTMRAKDAGEIVSYACSAPLSPEELENLNERLERLCGSADNEVSPHALAELDGDIVACFPSNSMLNNSELRHRALLSERTCVARLQIARAVAKARIFQARNARLPQTEADYLALFGGTPPRDPFTSSSLMRFRTEGNRCIFYCVGPDQKDEGGYAGFSATHMTTAGDDVAAALDVKPELPFSRTELRADSARDVLEAFPEGLPNDPFAGRTGMRLGILDGGTSWPVAIFSHGPDLDTKYTSTTSTLWDFTIPPDQPVLRAVAPGQPLDTLTPGTYSLQPPYDPTNGTYSKGDVFLQLPRKTPLSAALSDRPQPRIHIAIDACADCPLAQEPAEIAAVLPATKNHLRPFTQRVVVSVRSQHIESIETRQGGIGPLGGELERQERKRLRQDPPEPAPRSPPHRSCRTPEPRARRSERRVSSHPPRDSRSTLPLPPPAPNRAIAAIHSSESDAMFIASGLKRIRAVPSHSPTARATIVRSECSPNRSRRCARHSSTGSTATTRAPSSR